MKLEINYINHWKNHKYVDMKQQATEQPMGQSRN